MLRIGTRASALARWQADWVASRLRDAGHEVEFVLITTRGDADQRDSLARLGATPGVFTKELEQALLDSRVDVAVHSLKDMPTEETAGLTIAAIPPRESPFDALVSQSGLTLDQLPQGATIGAGGIRRRAQLLRARPDLVMKDIRGNVDTRLAKLDAGEFDAIVLAEAGLRRLGVHSRISQVFTPQLMLPAVGQGALAVQTRADDDATIAAVTPLESTESRAAVTAERSMLAALLGGCLAPIGGWAAMKSGMLSLTAAVLSADGRQCCEANQAAEPEQALELGRQVAAVLAELGAEKLLEDARKA